MAKYLIQKNVSLTLRRQLVDYVDPADSKKWKHLLDIVERIHHPKIRERFSEMPPEELSAWIEIYKLIPDDHFEICNEELSSANTQWKITNNEEGDDYDPDDPYVDITIDE